jgi:hypothetical protein
MIRVGWMISAHRIGRIMTSESARSHAVTAAEINPSEWPGQNLLGKTLMELRSEFVGKKAEVAKKRSADVFSTIVCTTAG